MSFEWLIVLLLCAILFVVVAIIFLIYRFQKKQELPTEMQPEVLKGIFATSLQELNVDQNIGSVKTLANQILQSSQDLKSMLELKRGRARFSEFQLSELLGDILPSDKYDIRKNIPGIGTPDACIKSTDGLICIDAKFPLENYKKIVNEKDDKERKKLQKLFANNVRDRIEEIRTKYIAPNKGTTPFAFGYIPSEAIYQYLTEQEQKLIRQAAKDGVMLASPSTLTVNLNLIYIGIKAQRLTEEAENIEKNLQQLDRLFNAFEDDWDTLKGHVTNAKNRMEDADKKYRSLKEHYAKTAKLDDREEL